jgi:hypothetical protein
MVDNGWTEKISSLEREIAKKDDEIRILKLRLATAKKVLDDIAQLADRIN